MSEACRDDRLYFRLTENLFTKPIDFETRAPDVQRC